MSCWQLRVFFEVFSKWIQIIIYFVENPQCFVLFQFYRFFCWMNFGYQGWAFAMVTRHSFRNRWFQNGAGNLWAAFVAAPVPSWSGFLCITATTVNQFRLWMSLDDSEFVSVILNSKLIIQTFHIISFKIIYKKNRRVFMQNAPILLQGNSRDQRLFPGLIFHKPSIQGWREDEPHSLGTAGWDWFFQHLLPKVMNFAKFLPKDLWMRFLKSCPKLHYLLWLKFP